MLAIRSRLAFPAVQTCARKQTQHRPGIRLARHDRREQAGTRLFPEAERRRAILALGAAGVAEDLHRLNHCRQREQAEIELRVPVRARRDRQLTRPISDSDRSHASNRAGERGAVFASLVRKLAGDRRARRVEQCQDDAGDRGDRRCRAPCPSAPALPRAPRAAENQHRTGDDRQLKETSPDS